MAHVPEATPMIQPRWNSFVRFSTAVLIGLACSAAANATPSISSLSITSGPIGISVTITGTSFGASQGTSTVKFNGTAAMPCGPCWSNTSISVMVPTGATTGNVAVNVGGVDSNGT